MLLIGTYYILFSTGDLVILLPGRPENYNPVTKLTRMTDWLLLLPILLVGKQTGDFVYCSLTFTRGKAISIETLV